MLKKFQKQESDHLFSMKVSHNIQHILVL